MKDFPGTPGTFTGLFLRISQFLFAAGAIASMATADGFTSYTAFCYLIASMGLQVIWCLGLACLDAYALFKKKLLRNPILVSLFVVGDWVTATLSLAAASSSAGIVVLYDRDLGYWLRGIFGFFFPSFFSGTTLVLIRIVNEIFHRAIA